MHNNAKEMGDSKTSAPQAYPLYSRQNQKNGYGPEKGQQSRKPLGSLSDTPNWCYKRDCRDDPAHLFENCPNRWFRKRKIEAQGKPNGMAQKGEDWRYPDNNNRFKKLRSQIEAMGAAMRRLEQIISQDGSEEEMSGHQE